MRLAAGLLVGRVYLLVMSRFTLDDSSAKVLAPLLPMLEQAGERLPVGPEVRVRLAPTSGFAAYARQTLLLSAALGGPDLHHPDERRILDPLDRWRRAAGCVLEGVALAALEQQSRASYQPDWRWIGAAVLAAHRAAPDLGLLPPELALARSTGDLHLHPRAGAGAYLAMEYRGEDPWQRAVLLASGGHLEAEEWLALGRVVMSSGFGGSRLVATPTAPPRDIPVQIGPWRWQPLEIPAHPRGGRVGVRGPGAVVQPWARGRAVHRTLAASTEGCELLPEEGGPSGRWSLLSTHTFGRIHGARGVVFQLHPSGVLDLELADAFVGPVDALEVAEQVGTSGISRGRWRVHGPQQLVFEGLRGATMTFHDKEGGVVVPQGGLGGALEALCQEPWAWELVADRLHLDGTMFGGPVHLRLEKR